MNINHYADRPAVARALYLLEEAKSLLIMEGEWDRLASLGDWSPVHHSIKKNKEIDKLKSEIILKNDTIDGMHRSLRIAYDNRRERIATACLSGLLSTSNSSGYEKNAKAVDSALVYADDLIKKLDATKL